VRDVIELRDLRFDAIVGLLDFERVTPQPVSLDIDLVRPFAEAAATDDVAHTTNYALVITLAQRVVIEGRFLLLETLVARVAESILAFDGAIASVTVAVKKLRPPVEEVITSVGVRTTLSR
jgi:dihydroneopterin aldolase